MGRRPLVPGLVSMREMGRVRDSELMTGSLIIVGERRAASSLVRFFVGETYSFGSTFARNGGGGAGNSYRGCKRSYIIDGGATRTLEALSESL